jgi:lysophospholipase L1-like esterase
MPTPNTNVDAVTISIGANDILFGYLVVVCTVPGQTDCTISKPIIDQRLAALGGRLDLLAAELALLSIDPARILLVEYPNPAQDENGDYCDEAPSGDLLRGIDKQEATWAGEYVLPRVNYKLCDAAKRHGWTYVDGIATRFEGHGWCAGGARWINTIGDSIARQRHVRGGLHPNEKGHRQVGERLAEVIGPMITTLPTGTTDCGPEPEP